MSIQLSEALNRDCQCVTVDRARLHQQLEDHLCAAGLPASLTAVHQNLFADSPVFVAHSHIKKMAALIDAHEALIHHSSYQAALLADAPAIAQTSFGPRGVFCAYDFHLGEQGPQLIEVNTNAGGVLLNLYLSDAQQACCDAVTDFVGGQHSFKAAETAFFSMFEKEWHLQKRDRALQTIAIVDERPEDQFLYPEFLLFKSLFERQRIKTIIADPSDFSIKAGVLTAQGCQIDLVYNRLTDFYLAAPQHAVLNAAYQQGLAVFTPSPHIYACYADKSHLPLLSDVEQLEKLGVAASIIDVLNKRVPMSERVSCENADRLWRDRKGYFFKPVTGYGSRGAYRGAKLTRKTWAAILQSDYIAQALVPPSERQLMIDGERQSMKIDLRCVTYAGQIQWVSARLYQGQTTNMRTKGGGLATVFVANEGACC